MSVDGAKKSIHDIQLEIEFINIKIDYKKHEIEIIRTDIEELKNQIEMLEYGTTEAMDEVVNLWMRRFSRNSLIINLTVLPLISAIFAGGFSISLSPNLSLIRSILILLTLVILYVAMLFGGLYFVEKIAPEPTRFKAVVDDGINHLKFLHSEITKLNFNIKNKNLELNELYTKLEDDTKAIHASF
jgi:hypothetical protein